MAEVGGGFIPADCGASPVPPNLFASIVVSGTTLSATTSGTSLLPGKAYDLRVTWPSLSGSFAPFALAAKVAVNLGIQANRNDLAVGPNAYGWTIAIPTNAASPYAAISLTINSAVLVGVYSGLPSVTGTWAITAL